MNRSKRTNSNKRHMASDGYVRMSAAIVITAVKDLKKIRTQLSGEFVTPNEVETYSKEAIAITRFLQDKTNPFIELLKINYPVLDEAIDRMLKEYDITT